MQTKDALPPLREDSHGVIPYAGEPKLALYSIERELTELLDMRVQTEEEGALPAELEAIDKTIAEYFTREVKKVDGICHALHAFDVAADAAQLECDRLHERAKNLRSQYDRIKAATLRAMQDHSVRVLETPTNKLRVRANGGKEPLEVADVHKLPAELRLVNVRLREDIWIDLLELAEAAAGGTKTFKILLECSNAAKPEPDNDAVRAALKELADCPECIQGRSVDYVTPLCEICHGRGTIPNTVPGAKLLPRGFHLRVE